MMSIRFACGWCLMWPRVSACVRETPSGLAMAGPEPRTLRRQPLTNKRDSKKSTESGGGEGASTVPSAEVPLWRAIGNDSQCPVCPPCPVTYIRSKGPCAVTDVVLVTMVAVVIALLVALMLTTLLRHRQKKAADATGTGSTPAAGRRTRRRRFGSLWHRSIASIRGGSDRSMRQGWKWRRQTRWEDVSEKEVTASDVEDKRNKMNGRMRGTPLNQYTSEESESPINATRTYGTVGRRGVSSDMSPATTMTEATESSASSYGRTRPSAVLPSPTQAAVMSGDDTNRPENIRRRSANILESLLYSDPQDPEGARRSRTHPSRFNPAARRTLTGEGPSGLSPKHPPISHDSEMQELLRRMTAGRSGAATREGEGRQSVVVPSDVEPPHPNSDA